MQDDSVCVDPGLGGVPPRPAHQAVCSRPGRGRGYHRRDGTTNVHTADGRQALQTTWRHATKGNVEEHN